MIIIIVIFIIIIIIIIKRTHPDVKNDAPINQVQHLKYFYESNLIYEGLIKEFDINIISRLILFILL